MGVTLDRVVEEKKLSIQAIADASALGPDRVLAIVEGRWLASPKERASIAAVLEIDPKQIDWGHTMSPRNIRYHRFGLPEDFSS